MDGGGARGIAMAKGQEEKEELKPWEQHSKVIGIPRFDYKAPSSLLDRPHSGFLVTCPIKREKSATKEAISILEKYSKEHSNECGIADSEHDAKRRKLCSKEMEEESLSRTEEKDAFDATGSYASADANGATLVENCLIKGNLSLVKLKKNGLLLFTFLDDNQHCAVNVLLRILFSLESGDLKRPEWCFRIFPIQETCILKEKDLYMVVSKLVQGFLNGAGSKLEKPIKFAICYERRVDETNKTAKPSVADGTDYLDLLDRDTCFKVVAKVVKDVVSDAVVDLKSPELIVRIELLPVSGLPAGSLVAGVSVLPKTVLSIKSQGICMKSLVSDTKLNKQHG